MTERLHELGDFKGGVTLRSDFYSGQIKKFYIIAKSIKLEIQTLHYNFQLNYLNI